ncbi:hypothetical protein D3C86_1780140 [compost metagenome]
MLRMTKITPPLVRARVTIKVRGMPKPGTSVSIRIRAPKTKATKPPMPSTPKLGRKASAAMKAIPSRIKATPA